MEWITNIASYGLPWWAVFIVILLTWLSTKGVDAWIKFRKTRLEERQYEDVQVREVHTALEAELRKQIEELRTDFRAVLEELKQARADHVDCKLEQERLRGHVALLQEKVARLEGHDKRGEEHIKSLRDAVKQIDPEAAAKLP
jgi:chromosome segregation ATPase